MEVGGFWRWVFPGVRMNKKQNIFAGIAGLALALFAAGCSSVAGHVSSNGGDVCREIFLEPVPDEVVVFAPRIVSFLEVRGFVFVHEKTDHCLRLRFTYDPDVWKRSVAIELSDLNRPLVASRSVNSGWGNMFAQGSATAHLAKTASKKFEEHCASRIKTVNLRASPSK